MSNSSIKKQTGTERNRQDQRGSDRIRKKQTGTDRIRKKQTGTAGIDRIIYLIYKIIASQLLHHKKIHISVRKSRSKEQTGTNRNRQD